MDERILKYLDNDLDNNERIKFENDLKQLPELKKEYDKYLVLNNKFNYNKVIEVDETYFNGIVPEFRNRLETKKKSKRIFAFSFANSLAAIIIFYLVLSPNKSLNLNEIAKNWNENDINNAIEYAVPNSNLYSLTDEYDYSSLDSVVSTMLTDELNLTNNSEVMQLIDNSIDYNNLTSQISTAETNELYNTILNKKYF